MRQDTLMPFWSFLTHESHDIFMHLGPILGIETRMTLARRFPSITANTYIEWTLGKSCGLLSLECIQKKWIDTYKKITVSNMKNDACNICLANLPMIEHPSSSTYMFCGVSINWTVLFNCWFWVKANSKCECAEQLSFTLRGSVSQLEVHFTNYALFLRQIHFPGTFNLFLEAVASLSWLLTFSFSEPLGHFLQQTSELALP